jgi:hypothetical protein
LLIGFIPLVLTYFHYGGILMSYCLLLIITNLIIGLFVKKSLWQLITCTVIEKADTVSRSKVYLRYLLLAALLPFIVQSVKEYCFFQKEKTFVSNSRISMPVSIPAKCAYVSDINKHKRTDAVDYVLQLFDDCDFVVLAERLHPECKQWELFSQIILNERFVEKVGNVYTEFGNINNQEEFDKYMNSDFDSVEDLEKATARNIRENGGWWDMWTNRNIFDFILNLHQYNAKRDSSDRINLFFSDGPVDWSTVHTHQQWKEAFYGVERDSIMAANIITHYKMKLGNSATRKKALVIMNTRHAFHGAVPADPGTTDYLFDEFPGKVANVLINGSTQFLYPAKSGLLDEAALEMKDSIWAVSFDNCLLGNAFFDLMPLPFLSANKKYKEVFNGMIYCAHPKDFLSVEGYKYMLDGFKDTLYRRRSIVRPAAYIPATADELSEEEYYRTRVSPFIKIYNIAWLFLHYVILLFLLINITACMLKQGKAKIE